MNAIATVNNTTTIDQDVRFGRADADVNNDTRIDQDARGRGASARAEVGNTTDIDQKVKHGSARDRGQRYPHRSVRQGGVPAASH